MDILENQGTLVATRKVSLTRENTVTRKAAIYTRISSDTEGREAGVERQKEDARRLAKRHGWTVVDVYRDNDVSATSGRRRPDWERLLTDLEAGRIDAIAAYSSSRMYRRPRDLQRLIDLTKTHDIEIDTVVSGRIDLTTADGRMLAGILAQIDQGEAERTSERLKRAFAKGKAPGGSRRAFGYRKDWTIDPDEAALLKEAVRRIIRGATSYRICMDWNAQGITTPYGARWRPSHLKRTLRGRHLVGAGGRPALLTEDEHKLLLAALDRIEQRGNGKPKKDSKGRIASPGRPSGRRYAALGLMRCGLCRDKLTGRSGHYICQGCGKLGIKATPTERFLVYETFLHAPHGQPPEPEPTADVEPLLARLRAVDDEYTETEAAIDEGDMPVRAGGRRLVKLDEEREELQRQLGQNLPAAEAAGPLLTADILADDRWESRTFTDSEMAVLQDFLRTFVASVAVSPAPNGGRGRQRFRTERLTIEWKQLIASEAS